MSRFIKLMLVSTGDQEPSYYILAHMVKGIADYGNLRRVIFNDNNGFIDVLDTAEEILRLIVESQCPNRAPMGPFGYVVPAGSSVDAIGREMPVDERKGHPGEVHD